jgi:hypothetical protein
VLAAPALLRAARPGVAAHLATQRHSPPARREKPAPRHHPKPCSPRVAACHCRATATAITGRGGERWHDAPDPLPAPPRSDDRADGAWAEDTSGRPAIRFIPVVDIEPAVTAIAWHPGSLTRLAKRFLAIAADRGPLPARPAS